MQYYVPFEQLPVMLIPDASQVMGLMVPGSAAIPAVHADRLRAAEETGRAAARLLGTDRTLDKVITQASVDNAVRGDPPVHFEDQSDLHGKADEAAGREMQSIQQGMGLPPGFNIPGLS